MDTRAHTHARAHTNAHSRQSRHARTSTHECLQTRTFSLFQTHTNIYTHAPTHARSLARTHTHIIPPHFEAVWLVGFLPNPVVGDEDGHRSVSFSFSSLHLHFLHYFLYQQSPIPCFVFYCPPILSHSVFTQSSRHSIGLPRHFFPSSLLASTTVASPSFPNLST